MSFNVHARDYTGTDWPLTVNTARRSTCGDNEVTDDDPDERRFSILWWLIPTVVFWAGIGWAASSWGW